MDVKETLAWVASKKLQAERSELDLEQAARLMQEIRHKLDFLRAASAEVSKAYDYFRIVAVPDLMDEVGITTVTYEGLGRVTLTSDLHASIPASVREKSFAWLEENGYGDLIKDTINSSTLKAFCKRRIKEGEDLPENFFKVTPFSRASVTKVN